MHSEESRRIRDLESKVAELEKALEKKQILIDYLEKVIEIASNHLPYDILKGVRAQLRKS